MQIGAYDMRRPHDKPPNVAPSERRIPTGSLDSPTSLQAVPPGETTEGESGAKTAGEESFPRRCDEPDLGGGLLAGHPKMKVLALESSPSSQMSTLAGIYRRNWRFIHTAAVHRIGNVHDAEDVTQDAFIRCGKALLTGTVIVDERPYLLTALGTSVADYYKENSRRPPPVPEPETEGENEIVSVDFGGDAIDPELLEALNELPERQREVIFLTEILGLKPQQASRILVDVMPERISRYKYKALKNLRASLARKKGRAS
uniref:RNA polymerase sigma factor n=1 Tax=Saccharothrix espanaensis TaxID=103731 RepID=UPI003F497E4F